MIEHCEYCNTNQGEMDQLRSERDRLKERLARILGVNVGPGGTCITGGVPSEVWVAIGTGVYDKAENDGEGNADYLIAQDVAAAVREQEVKPLARELLRYLTMGVFNRCREQVEARITSPNCCPATKADSSHIMKIARLAGGWWVDGEFKEET